MSGKMIGYTYWTIAACVLVGVINLINGIDKADLTTAIISVYLLIITVGVSGFISIKSIKDVLNPIFLTSCIFLLWFGYSPLFIIAHRDLDFDNHAHLNDLILKGELYALGGFLCYVAGFSLSWRARGGVGKLLPVLGVRFGWMRILRLFSMLAGVAAVAYFFNSVGGVSYYWLNEVNERYKYVAGRGYLIFLTIFPLMVGIYSYCLMLISKKRDPLGLVYIALGFVLAISTGSRGRGILPILLLVMMLYYIGFSQNGFSFARNRINTKKYLGLALILVVIFYIGTTLMEIRRVAHVYSSINDAVVEVMEGRVNPEGVASISEKVFHSTLSYYWYLKLLDYLEREQDFQLGSTLVQAFILPIPRAVWSGKPADTPGTRFGKIATGVFVGAPYTYVGDFYWNFHVPGVVIGMFFLGIFFGKFYLWMLYNLQNGRAMAILLYCTVSPVLIISIAGTFYGAADTLIQYSFAFCLVAFCFKRRRRRYEQASNGIR